MSSNTGSNGEERVVSVTEKGQATIPKTFREKHGIPAPGRVKFVENEDGEIVVRPVGSMREFRGLERSGDDERPATAVLRESRADDKRRSDELVERVTGAEGDENESEHRGTDGEDDHHREGYEDDHRRKDGGDDHRGVED